MSAKLEVIEVVKSYPASTASSGRLQALGPVSFDVKPNELVSVVGPSGCGKTTLLRIIHGLIQPDSGRVVVDGKVATGDTRPFATVFQDIRLLPWRTALGNIEMALEVRHHRKLGKDEREQARLYLQAVGLEAFAGMYPHQLSGGMQQRVGVARALVVSPEIVLLDEPFGSLDAQTRWVTQDMFLSLQERYGLSAVLVTHDIDEAVYMSSRCVVMSRRPGAVKAIVDVDLPLPRHGGIRAHGDLVKFRSRIWDLMRYDVLEASLEAPVQ